MNQYSNEFLFKEFSIFRDTPFKTEIIHKFYFFTHPAKIDGFDEVCQLLSDRCLANKNEEKHFWWLAKNHQS